MKFKSVAATLAGLVVILAGGAAATVAPAVSGSEQAVRRVDIDILPNRKENEIKLSEKDRSIQVVLLGEANFSVSQVEPGSVMIGETLPVAQTGRRLDSNFDQNMDAEYRFQIGKLALADTTKELCLTGKLLDGQVFRGCGHVVITP